MGLGGGLSCASNDCSIPHILSQHVNGSAFPPWADLARRHVLPLPPGILFRSIDAGLMETRG